MTDNLDFGKTIGTMNPSATSTKLTIYGTQGTIPTLNPIFPNAYLTPPDYGVNNSITGTNGPKLNIYRSIPETRYPFTYIGTHAIQNIQFVGQINPDAYTPKISVYQQVQGTLVYSFNYNIDTTPNSSFISSNIPLITGTALTIVNIVPIISGATPNWTITVTVNISYIDNGTTFGLSFVNCSSFYNSSFVTNLSITNLTNIPLTRTGGNQFADLTNISTTFFASNAVVPTILPNTNLNKCFYLCTYFNSDISNWDTSNVTSMNNMFNNFKAFNKNIGDWNITNVTSISGMFFGCSIFNQNINNWNVTNVTNISYIFYDCLAFINSNIPMTWNWTIFPPNNFSYLNWHAGAPIGQGQSGRSILDIPLQLRSKPYW